MPLIFDIVWCPLEIPLRNNSTPFNLLFQAASIRKQLCVREVLAANLNLIMFIYIIMGKYIAAVLSGFFGRRLQLELPPVAMAEVKG
jgi:hypothetical protein